MIIRDYLICLLQMYLLEDLEKNILPYRRERFWEKFLVYCIAALAMFGTNRLESSILNMVMIPVIYMIASMVVFRGSIWKKLVTVCCYYVLAIIPEFLFAALTNAYGVTGASEGFRTETEKTLALLLMSTMTFLFIKCINQVTRKRDYLTIENKTFTVLLMLPTATIVMLGCMFYSHTSFEGMNRVMVPVGASLLLMTNIFIFTVFDRFVEKSEEVKKMDRLYQKSRAEIANLQYMNTDIEYVQVDVRNRKELIKFCQNCSIVINCTGASYYLSREIASVVCEHNIDYIDTFGIGIDKEELYNYESTMIIGAGSFPGLSGILPVWIRKEQQESEIRRVNIFAGGNEHITASACADFLLSTFSQFGKIDSYYSHQQIKKTENITERVPLIFPDTAEIMEYLPDEIYLSAEYSRIDELHWYNVQTNSEYRNIIQEALLKLMISQEYEYVNRLAENVKRKLENKREESKTWYRIWLEIETVTEKKNYGYEALDSYKINGRIAAFCAEALCSGICQKGIYWPFEILDAEIVMNSLINEEILIGLKENDKKMQEHDLNYEEGEL